MSVSLPGTMRAIEIEKPGGPGVLRLAALAMPRPGSAELLVKVKAAGVNRPDVLQRKGAYPPPPGAPSTPGLEIAGSIVAKGDEANRFSVGDDICGLVPGGGYA